MDQRDEKFTQNVMRVPDRIAQTLYDKSPLDDFRRKLFAPLKNKERIVSFVGYQSDVEVAMRSVQTKIDILQNERHEWLRSNADEKEKREILRKIELEKIRGGNNTVESDLPRLYKELSIVEETLKKKEQEPKLQ